MVIRKDKVKQDIMDWIEVNLPMGTPYRIKDASPGEHFEFGIYFHEVDLLNTAGDFDVDEQFSDMLMDRGWCAEMMSAYSVIVYEDKDSNWIPYHEQQL